MRPPNKQFWSRRCKSGHHKDCGGLRSIPHCGKGKCECQCHAVEERISE